MCHEESQVDHGHRIAQDNYCPLLGVLVLGVLHDDAYRDDGGDDHNECDYDYDRYGDVNENGENSVHQYHHWGMKWQV